MPRTPEHPSNYPGCPQLTNETYCSEHKKVMTKQYNQYERDLDVWKRYGSQWRKVRAAYISAHPLCELCLQEGRMTPAEHVHHLKEIKHGGTHEYENLQSLCMHHHSRITRLSQS